MGAAQSRPHDRDEDESLGIAEMFSRAQSVRRLPLMARIALFFPWTRRFVIKRFPTRTRHAGLDSIDSMGEMRAVLSAMGGWGEEDNPTAHGQRARQRRQRASVRREQRRQREWGRRADKAVRRRSLPPPSIHSGYLPEYHAAYEAGYGVEYDRDQDLRGLDRDPGPSPTSATFPFKEPGTGSGGNIAAGQADPSNPSNLFNGHHPRESARDHILEQIHDATVRWRDHSAHRIQRRYSAVV